MKLSRSSYKNTVISEKRHKKYSHKGVHLLSECSLTNLLPDSVSTSKGLNLAPALPTPRPCAGNLDQPTAERGVDDARGQSAAATRARPGRVHWSCIPWLKSQPSVSTSRCRLRLQTLLPPS